MSLPALLVLLVVCSLTLLAEFLLWHALRHGNRSLLHRISGLILLAFGLILLFALYNLLVKPNYQASWPWYLILSALIWYLGVGSSAPFFWVGIDLVRNGPLRPAKSPALLDWRLMLFMFGSGCLLGVIVGFGWFNVSLSLFISEKGQGSAPFMLGLFSLDRFLQGFLWATCFILPATYCPWLSWWVRSFSERRWFAIGTTLLLLSLASIARLI